ncbi:TVG0411609 [Thermoplasma volcanium GSS1]|uniref:TVG0411609 protein n=1 Tax=Thermoplasma volcanium (strain ATCC 51530 / DSM 4299 / JCM 9571 / NBRC 15438 / GSS1) TaxID=273116 RepID=Q97BM9_THEVO|nr:hypothetical protein [Thermoplasma volcanium]BAB59568.1 TVG0411609 [Thermoplasma volcanium GSS1]
MNSILMPPSLDYLVAVRVKVPNPIPEKYWKSISDEFYGIQKYYHIGAMFVKESGHWNILMNAFKVLPTEEVISIVDYINNVYTKMGLGTVVSNDAKHIIRSITDISDKSIDRLAGIDGLVLYPVISIGNNELIMVFEYPEEASDEVSRMILDYVNKAPLPAEIIKMEMKKPGDKPSLFKAIELKGIDPSSVLILHTRWFMKLEEFDRQVGGIFRNLMAFRIKKFDRDAFQLIAEVFGNELKFDGQYKVYRKSEKSQIVQFTLNTGWFKDFFDDVIKVFMGPVDYWGYSDGIGNVDNYFMIRKSDQADFLKALGKHWKNPIRYYHRNRLMEIVPMSDILPSDPRNSK